MIGAGNDKQFKLLADRILQKPELSVDPRFVSNEVRVANRAELVKIIEEALRQHPQAYWQEKFTGQGIPFGPINNIQQTFQHPQAVARNMVVEIEHPRAGNIKLVAPAVMYNGERMPVVKPPPWLSQHTSEVLHELGYNTEEVAELRKNGIV